MPTVSTGGAPQVAIAPSAATASRHTTSGDGRFAALLAPLAAELGKGESKSPQPETLDRSAERHHQPADRPKFALQPLDDATAEAPRNPGDGAKARPTQADATKTKPGEIADPVVRDLATTPGNLMPGPTGSAVPRPQIVRGRTEAQVGPETEPAAITADVAVDANQGQNKSSLAMHDGTKDAAVVSKEVTPRSDGRPETKADSRSRADEQNSGIAMPANAVGMVAVTESPPAAAVPAPEPARPSEAASSVVVATPEMPVKANVGMPDSAGPQRSPDKAARETTQATVAEVKHASIVPQLDTTDASPAVSAAAAVAGAHVAAKSQSDIANSVSVTSLGSVDVVSSGALVAALPQPVAARLPVTTNGTPHSDAGNSSVVTSAGTVAPADANTAGRPALDRTYPPLAPTLPAYNGIAATAAPQNQPHDVRSDAGTSPPYIAGVATPTAPSDASIVPPAALPTAPPAGTATLQVAMHVAQSLNAGGKTVTIELHPAELGRVEIHFSFHSDGTDVRLTVDRPETFDAFSHDRSGLQQQLAQAGVDLGGGGLDLRLGQQQPDQSGSYSSGRTPRVAMSTPQPDARPATLWVSNSLLDILA